MKYLIMAACVSCAAPTETTISVEIVPQSFTRPCLSSHVVVFDSEGNKHAAPESSCNKFDIVLAPGVRFMGVEQETTEIDFISVYIDEN